MLLSVLRALFVITFMIVGLNYAEQVFRDLQPFQPEAILIVSLGIALLVIGLDVFIPQKSLLAISGVFFGLVVGMLVTYGASLILNLFVEAYELPANTALMSTLKVAIGLIACYLSISFILQTKDDVRFVIPYVEFVKERKGSHPLILDTSVIIDGRISDVLETWQVDAPVVIPRFVLEELQMIADSGDRLKRNRGRRGLDILNTLQKDGATRLEISAMDAPDVPEVDGKLVALARRLDCPILTNDYNLNRVAELQGVSVLNVNELANAVKVVVLPGEVLNVQIIQDGKEVGQGVAYLDDGTMVVVEEGRRLMGQSVDIVVTRVLQTVAGRMVFGHPQNGKR